MEFSHSIDTQTIIDREDFPLVWYDQGKNLYSMENLTIKLKKEYECQITQKKKSFSIFID